MSLSIKYYTSCQAKHDCKGSKIIVVTIISLAQHFLSIELEICKFVGTDCTMRKILQSRHLLEPYMSAPYQKASIIQKIFPAIRIKESQHQL